MPLKESVNAKALTSNDTPIPSHERDYFNVLSRSGKVGGVVGDSIRAAEARKGVNDES